MNCKSFSFTFRSLPPVLSRCIFRVFVDVNHTRTSTVPSPDHTRLARLITWHTLEYVSHTNDLLVSRHLCGSPLSAVFRKKVFICVPPYNFWSFVGSPTIQLLLLSLRYISVPLCTNQQLYILLYSSRATFLTNYKTSVKVSLYIYWRPTDRRRWRPTSL